MKYCDDSSHKFCEIYYWVNKKANSWFPMWGTENYSMEEVAEVMNNYLLGVEKKSIPEWVTPRNSNTEYKIIQYLIKSNRAIKSGVEGKIRAIFAELVNSVNISPGSDRFQLNPCYLYPASEKCDGTTERSKIYLEQTGNGKDDKPSALFEWNNLFQTITILSVAGLVTYAGVKYVSSKDYKQKRLAK